MPPSESASKEKQRRRDNHQKGHERNSESAPANGKNKAARVGGEQWCGNDKQYETENNDEEAKGAKRNEFRNRLLSHGYIRLAQRESCRTPELTRRETTTLPTSCR
jgi:hypothetical protein